MSSNLERVVIPGLVGFDAAFGELGLRVGARTGDNKRTQDDKEWYVVRRLLKEAMVAKLFEPPLSIWKTEPPDPDFRIEFGRDHRAALIEITEATHPDDQREMTEFELSDKKAMLIGELGGRFSGGASEPGHVWASDILDAIERKTKKSIFSLSGERHLIIYPNSNASFLIFDEEDESRAFSLLRKACVPKVTYYAAMANGCVVHILGKEYICFDMLREFCLIKRSAN